MYLLWKGKGEWLIYISHLFFPNFVFWVRVGLIFMEYIKYLMKCIKMI